MDLKEECLNICNDELVAKFVDLVSECATLFAKKHNDYGPGSVALFGNVGLYVRMCDKIWRLRNLLFESKEPKNESIEDTLKDIANYALIWLLYLKGEWPKPENPFALPIGELP
jgi:hypothetical protein